MRIIIPTNNEESNFDKNNEKYFIVDTNNIPPPYNSKYYCEIGKQLHVWKNDLIKDEIVGMYQNRRYFINEESINDHILDQHTIVVPTRWSFGTLTLYDQILMCHGSNIYLKEAINIIFEKDEIDFLKNTFSGYFHNIFITRKNIFNDYSKFLDEKLIKLYNFLEEKENIPGEFTNQKYGAWFAERILNIFLKNYNFKILEKDITTLCK